MDNMDVVHQVVQKDFKSGVSAKTGKPWAMHKYSSNSGKEFTSFDDLEPGDSVKLTYSEEYKNWSGGRVRKADTQHDEIIRKLDEVLALLGRIPETEKKSGYDKAKTQAENLRPDTLNKDIPIDATFGDYGGF